MASGVEKSFWNRREVADAIAALAGASHVTILAGAGVSMESHLPSWRQLLESLLKSPGSPTTPENQKAFYEAILQSEGLLGAGAIAKALHKGSFVDALKTALYAGAVDVAPGPTAMAIAELRRQLGLNCTLLTMNYDSLLEKALELVTGKSAKSWVKDVQNPEQGVFHLHGFVPESGRPQGTVILGEEDYVRMKDTSWQESLIHRCLDTRNSKLLIIGSSMTDYNILKYVYRYSKPRKIFALMTRSKAPTRVHGGDDATARAYFEAVSRKWREGANVEPIYIDHLFQASQFVYEILYKKSQKGAYKTYRSRCEEIEARQDHEHHPLSRKPADLPAAQSIIRERLAKLQEDVDRLVSRKPNEYRSLHLHRRWFDKKALVLVGSSDRTWYDEHAYVPVPLQSDSQHLAVKAMSSGVVVSQSISPASSRWEFQLAIPISTPVDGELGRIPVGCVVLTSSLPGEIDDAGSETRERTTLSNALGDDQKLLGLLDIINPVALDMLTEEWSIDE